MQEMTLKIKGLYTHPSDLSEVPEGSLEVANNVNIDKESIATPRRGYDRQTYAFGTASDRIKSYFEYKNTLLSHYGSTLQYDEGNSHVAYTGSFDQPDSDTKIRSAKSNQNFYFTTDGGVKKLDSLTATPVSSGAVKGLTMEGTTTGATGYMADDTARAYRMLWGYEDANGNLILGAPSQRSVVTNSSGGTRNVELTITIPEGVTTNWILQIYRSASTDVAVTPSDEMVLVYENNPTSPELTAGTLTVTDIQVDDLTGATLYTSPSAETIAAANEVAPKAKDLAVFKNHMFYGNTQSKHRKTITMIAVPEADDVIAIGGVDYTFKAATTVDSEEVKRFTAGSVAQNIDDTAKELCKVINQCDSNTGSDAIYAYYVSGPNDAPGKFTLESRSVGGAQFALTFTPNASSDPWQPRLPTSGTSVSSENDTFANGLYFSKPQQPEAVPLSNQFRVGSADAAILRIVPLRDSLFVLKEDGVYRVTGENAASFSVELFDSTAKIQASQTAALLNNAVYFWSDQGIVQCTETGINIVSRPIETDLTQLLGEFKSGVQMYSFAVGYETDRKYILGTVTQSSDTYATQYFVYNTFTRAWTKWNGMDAQAAFVKTSDDKVYLADPSSNYVLVERKAFNATDHADYNTTSTISDVSADGLTITLTNSDQIKAGDVLFQSAAAFTVVRGVDSVLGTATAYFDGGLSAAACTVYAGIDASVQWAPITGKNPAMGKHFREVALLFKKGFRLSASFGFYTDISGSLEEVEVTSIDVGNFGFFEFGAVPFGGEVGRSPKRTLVPLEKSRATQLSTRFTHRLAFQDFELQGISAHMGQTSERFNR